MSAETAGRVRVVLFNGVCVRHDAISYSLRLKLDFFRSLRDAGHPVDVKAFVQGTDYADPDVEVRSLYGLIRDPAFSRADVLIYEFGIDYELFDSLFLLRGDQRSLGVYHNVTPLELVDSSHARKAVERGLLVRRNLGELDYVSCDSDFNRSDLIDCGIPPEKLGILPLPPRASLGPPLARSSNGPVDLLFVGRLVRAKGVDDLLEAVALLAAGGERNFRLTLAGSALFSDEGMMAAIDEAAGGQGVGRIRLVVDPDDATLDDLYRRSSVFVLPSHHEGYCLPVLEAFQAGCQVVASDAGNLPSIVAGLGQIVPTGDTRALASALRGAIAATRASEDDDAAAIPVATGALPPDAWRDAVAGHVARHSRAAYDRSFLEVLQQVGVELGDALVAA
jgi:glycosyltransferase involved in cell wall biosynthesis